MTLRTIGSRLLVATHNQGKLDEITALLAPYNIETLSAKTLGLPEPKETETTFVGNARLKAHAAARASGMPALADDSGIEIDILDGAPGVYTADWSETPTGRDFVHAMTTTWSKITERKSTAPYTARFRCTLVIAWPDGHNQVFEGKMEGQCVWPMRGTEGHGYDPMFQPDGYSVTFGEMDATDKNRISHRADAFRKFVTQCFD